MQKVDADFDEVQALLEKHAPHLDFGDSFNLYMRYYFAKTGHRFNKVIRRLYHNTRFGPHPSHQSRIQAAQDHMSQNS